MGTDPGTMSYMRTLATAQVTDEAWFIAVSKQCGMSIGDLTIDTWNEGFDVLEMGTVEKLVLPDTTGIVWNRPDGGMPMFIDDAAPEYITLARFLLFAGLIKAIELNGELSYAKVGGPPLNWKNAKVYLNGNDMENVVSADAILGTVEFHKKNKQGELLTNKEKGIIEMAKISGIVKIVPGEQPLTFF
jgi:hypothetical protein